MLGRLWVVRQGCRRGVTLGSSKEGFLKWGRAKKDEGPLEGEWEHRGRGSGQGGCRDGRGEGPCAFCG